MGLANVKSFTIRGSECVEGGSKGYLLARTKVQDVDYQQRNVSPKSLPDVVSQPQARR